MKKDNCFELGVISKTHSFKGELILYLDTDKPENYYAIDYILIEINRQLVPHFIERSKIHKTNHLRIKLEGIETEHEANLLTKKKVFLPLELLPQLKEDQFYYHEVTGFDIIDEKDNKSIGKLTEVIDHPSNRLINVQLHNGKEALLPFNDVHIQKVNKPEKYFILSIPEGLLDIY